MRRPLVMGIVNVTPDSFSDGGRFHTRQRAVEHAQRLLEEGADWLDIGGESTRPGADPVSIDDEMDRVVPVIRALRSARPNAVISIDTRRAAVARAAIEVGAQIVNDVSALADPQMAALCASSGTRVVLMHMRGQPRTMQQHTRYTDMVGEVFAFLSARLEIAVASGIAPERILIDPGLGFGKAPADSPALIAAVPRFRGISEAVHRRVDQRHETRRARLRLSWRSAGRGRPRCPCASRARRRGDGPGPRRIPGGGAGLSWLADWYQDSPFATATLTDWVDIALLAFLMYRGLLFLRGTRALQSLLGFAFLAMVYMLSELAGLHTLHWVLDSIFVWLALALIILFQEDIRRALARAGGTVFGRTSRPSDAHVMEEVIKACFLLGHRKIGALIAIERTASLAPYCEGAQQLDALVSTEVLQAIFHPTSPVHDGAVVLSDQRLSAVGVFLPISLSKEVGRAYGTRHRAAIGLTEQADALCLVVSEERGTVSLVQGGEVIPVADANDLRQRLRERLEKGQPVAEPARAGAASG
jgi:dihydropteroate synthase